MKPNAIWCLALAGLLWMNCTAPSDYKAYTKLVNSELAKNKREDSLLLGIHFGMSSKQFFTHCWDLNKKGVITNGSIDASILYKLDKEMSHPVSMNFYPQFYNDKIYKMWADFAYESWAPWNKHLFSDTLKNDVIQLYKKWYGENNFVTLSDSVKGTIYVKVDGNRRITIGRYDDIHVRVDYTDLLVEKLIKK